jgi:hypothetical protein
VLAYLVDLGDVDRLDERFPGGKFRYKVATPAPPG